jgi:phage nucleotide-binding protein
MKIITIEESLGKRGPKLAVYGAAGSGKTTLTATLPGKKLIASAEHGLLSVVGMADAGVVEIDTIDTLEEVLRYSCSPTCEYDWIVIDSLSEVAESLLSAEKGNTKDPRQAYGEVQDRIGAVLRGFRDSPCGVYAVLKELTAYDEARKVNTYSSSMPSKSLAASVPYVFDEFFRLVVDGDERYLLTRYDGRSQAKDRSGKLDKREPPDLGVVVEKVMTR